MNWLFGHMEDPDIDNLGDLGGDTAPTGEPASAIGGVSQESIEALGAMGILAPQARKALKETGGDVNRALDWVFSHPDDAGDFGEEEVAPAQAEDTSKEKALAGSAELPANFQLSSIVCHKGASIHTGHYVAFVRKMIPEEGPHKQWVLFNDEKVVKAADVDEMKRFAYVYFFERV